MEELKIPSTKNSPEVTLSPDGFIKVSGRSIHENIFHFFKPVEDWVNEYVKSPADTTCVDVDLEYCNSASSKLLINLLQKMSRVQVMHKKLVVNWYYEEGDEDILERGEYFSSVLNLPFNFIKTA
jgi:hypothetical protein